MMYNPFLSALHEQWTGWNRISMNWECQYLLMGHVRNVYLCQLQFLLFLFLQILHEHFVDNLLLLHLQCLHPLIPKKRRFLRWTFYFQHCHVCQSVRQTPSQGPVLLAARNPFLCCDWLSYTSASSEPQHKFLLSLWHKIGPGQKWGHWGGF